MTDSQAHGVIELSRFRAELSRALQRRGKRLIEAPDLASQVAALAPLEAYFIIKELGVDEAEPILRWVSGEQLRAFVDLDCWRDARPEVAEIDAWLAPFAALGPAALARAFLTLDIEVQVVFLGESLRVHEAGDDDPPGPVLGRPRSTTPDRYFVIDAVAADEREVHPFQLVEALYGHDVNEGFRLLTAVRWELKSSLEEEAYRLRCGRLEDLGFPSREDALALFSPAVAAAPPPEPPAVPVTLPALYAEALAGRSLVARALARIEDVALLKVLESGFVYLVNAAVVAYGEQPGDLAHVADIAARVRDTTSLALEVEGGGDEERAAEILARRPLRELFRAGHAEVMDLRRAAVAVAADPVIAQWLDRDEGDDDRDRADRAFLRALSAPRPLHAGFDAVAFERKKAFGSRAELAQAAAQLDALARRLL